MNSTFLFNDKIHDLVSTIETCLAFHLQLIQQFPMLVTQVVFLLTHRTTTMLMLNFQKQRYASLTVNRLSGKVFGISFPQPLTVKQIYLTLLNFLIWKVFSSKDVQEPIRSLLITSENYSIALKVLRKRYANN